MAFAPWDETVPQPTSYLSELAEVWRSAKSSFDTAIRTQFYWADSATSAGEPRLSTTTPGSCRVYYGARSAVSNPSRPGTFMVVSDESRLLAFPSANSVLVGSKGVMVVIRSGVTADVANARWLAQSGTANVNAGANNKVNFTTAYGAPPIVWVTANAEDGATSSGSYLISVYPGGGDAKSGFSLSVAFVDDGADPDSCNVMWYSEGTVAL